MVAAAVTLNSERERERERRQKLPFLRCSSVDDFVKRSFEVDDDDDDEVADNQRGSNCHRNTDNGAREKEEEKKGWLLQAPLVSPAALLRTCSVVPLPKRFTQ